MLSRERKISSEHFSLLKKYKKRLSTPHFSLFTYPSTDHTRCAFIVSKKNSKKAVIRNGLKRKGYAALGEFLPHIQEGVLLFVFSKRNAEKLSFTSIKNEIQELLLKRGILNLKED